MPTSMNSAIMKSKGHTARTDRQKAMSVLHTETLDYRGKYHLYRISSDCPVPGSQINREKVRKDASDGMMHKLASMTDENDRKFQSRRSIYAKTFDEKKKVLTTNMLKPGMRLDRKAHCSLSDCTHVAGILAAAELCTVHKAPMFIAKLTHKLRDRHPRAHTIVTQPPYRTHPPPR